MMIDNNLLVLQGTAIPRVLVISDTISSHNKGTWVAESAKPEKPQLFKTSLSNPEIPQSHCCRRALLPVLWDFCFPWMLRRNL